MEKHSLEKLLICTNAYVGHNNDKFKILTFGCFHGNKNHKGISYLYSYQFKFHLSPVFGFGILAVSESHALCVPSS